MSEISTAIITRKLCFSYQSSPYKKPVLNCVDMTVPQGMIYGLLGPSGCGKTSLLKVIIGLLKPDAGFVSVFDHQPGTTSDVPGVGVGYMPQEIGMQEYLKVNEIFQYFGKIYSKSDSTIEQRMHYFLNLLNLPDENAIIRNLSGGQKRRVSLAVAVFTEPRLLILDEPTVGVDPLLRNGIWQFLGEIASRERTTIIVTTHYIEEMKCAQKVAFMRDGEIIKEDTPNTVLAQYRKNSLEDVFYELSYNQEQRNSSILSIKDVRRMSQRFSENDSHTLINNKIKDIKYCASTNYSRTSILIWENFIKYYRNSGLILLLLLPMLVSFTASFAIGKIPDETLVGWVVKDHHSSYTPLLSNVTPIEDNPDHYNPYLPDLLHDQFEKSFIQLISYANMSKAIEDVKSTKIRGVIYIPANFSFAFYERDIYLSGHSEWIENATVEAGTVNITLDMSEPFLGNIVIHEVYKKVLIFREKAYEAIGVHRNISHLPIRITDNTNELNDENYSQFSNFITLNTFVVFIFVLSKSLTSIHFHVGHSEDVLTRCFSAGIKPHQIIIAVTIVNFVILAFSAIINLFFIIYVLNIPCKGNLMYAVINITSVSLSGVSSGLLFALLLPSTAICNIFSTGYVIVLAFISGTLWPLEAVPYFMKNVALILPIAKPTAAMRRIFDYQYMDFYNYVLPVLLVSFLHMILYLVISCCILRKKH